MRHYLTATIPFLLMASVVWGQPSCGAPPACCQPLGPSCEAPPPCAPEAPRAPQPPSQAPLYAAPQGVFVQPPASGTVRGPVQQRGIEGASLTFPELTLRLPSLRLPAFSHSRSSARMEIDSGMAPYVESAAAPMAPAMIAAAPMMAPVYAPPQQAPQQQAPPPQAPPSAPCAPRAPACDAPRAPSCDAAMLEERLRSLELAEQRLMLRLAELQNATGGAIPDPHPSLRLNPTPVREPVRILTAEEQAARSQQLAPQYLGPPLSPHQAPNQGASLSHPAYHEQPASYITEPQRLPVAKHWIVEPARPSARITGIRRGQ